MKNPLPLLALLAIAHVASAQPTNGTGANTESASEKPKATELPDARQLLDNLSAPYEAAKTFRGTFDFEVDDKDREHPLPISSLHIETLYRFNANGDKTGEVTTFRVVGKERKKEKTLTLLLVDDGQVAHLAYLEQKAWHLDEREPLPVLRQMFQLFVMQFSAQAMRQDPGFVPAISKGVDAGRDVYVLGDKNGQAFVNFRAVVDAQTRALRTLRLSSDTLTISVSGSRQAFDAPTLDSEFKWTPPAGFKQVKEGSIKVPSFLSELGGKSAAKN